MRRSRFIASAIALMFIVTCVFASGKKEATTASEKPIIAVSILPQAYFVERIGGERVSVIVLVGPGQEPHSYEPTPRQMEDLAQSKAWVLSNTEFEIALKPKIASLYPGLKIVDGTEGVRFRQMEVHTHEEGEQAEEEQEIDVPGNIDRHTWLGSEPAKIMARHIRDTLIMLDPAGKPHYERGYEALVSDIDREFGRLRDELAPLSGRTVFVFHPSFGYFFDEFGIRQEAVETGGKEPTAKALAALIEKAQEERVKAIFVQAQFPINAAQTVAKAVGAEVVPLDPLAPDWLDNIRRMGEALKKAFALSVQ